MSIKYIWDNNYSKDIATKYGSETYFNTRIREALKNVDENTKAIKCVKKWMEDKQNMLVLSGPPGVGKTIAVAWAGLHFQHRSQTMVDGNWTYLPNGSSMCTFLPSYKIGLVAPWELEKQKWFYNDVLIVDDLGLATGKPEDAQTKIDVLLSTRHEESKITIMTTNLNAREFTSYVGDRVIDRIRGDGVFVEINAASLRGQIEEKHK
tara:strand:- start:1068 stop:1688 length:621 start_codon:yes stop_codon:yes gene_type:complete